MFLIELSRTEAQSVADAPSPIYRAARWIKQFHQSNYSNIGWMDHRPGTPDSEVLRKYGFVRVPGCELNRIRLLLETYGPLLAAGALSHLQQNETTLGYPKVPLVQVSAYEEEDGAVVLNGYFDGALPRLLYCNIALPHKQFVIDVAELRGRLSPDISLSYLNCSTFPKPCAHIVDRSRKL